MAIWTNKDNRNKGSNTVRRHLATAQRAFLIPARLMLPDIEKYKEDNNE